ncbi:MAG: threonine aldolase [Spirochaetes bacterium DG_61]|nr:MAG: threonine aldolase [Spirochaetes bacterium DG_61]
MKKIDLRRDTITLPTEEMREEAFRAPLGDSVYDEDPKQIELEELAAKKLGTERALFVPSGTMGNLIALLTHTSRGDELIVEKNAHIRLSETGGAACVGGLMMMTVEGSDGFPDPDGVEHAIRADNIHYPKTALICLESTHYMYGGIVPPLEKLKRIREISEKQGIPLHLDGARLFNSCLYLEVPASQIVGYVDSVMISLSKWLGAPVGSVLCGSGEFVKKAKRYRKMLGGGMRQTGWLCACGILALSDENIERLNSDHENARMLAEALFKIEGVHIDLERVHTNFVLARFDHQGFSASRFLKQLSSHGVYATSVSDKIIRFVTSREVDAHDIFTAVEVIQRVLYS